MRHRSVELRGGSEWLDVEFLVRVVDAEPARTYGRSRPLDTGSS